MTASDRSPTRARARTPFPKLYWLVVLFELFERGSYYGVMSVLSVYLTDVLGFPKQDVGIIKGTIQPLLYFLPIVAGALADRFGYRRALFVAFSLLGGGYFLTSQATGYAPVFLSLVVMGIGAGTFKPVISGTIARCTDESNSTLGFGIFYWSINLGAFLWPLILVPLLKTHVGWDWVLKAAAIGTGAMLLPTLLLFREPPAADSPTAREDEAGPPANDPPDPKDGEQSGTQTDDDGPNAAAGPAPAKPKLLQTLANAFEIIYSPFVLLRAAAARSSAGQAALYVLLGALLGGGGWLYVAPHDESTSLLAKAFPRDGGELVVAIDRNLNREARFALEHDQKARRLKLTLHAPDHVDEQADDILAALEAEGKAWMLERAELLAHVADAERRTKLTVRIDRALGTPFAIEPQGGRAFVITVASHEDYALHADALEAEVGTIAELSPIGRARLDELVARAASPRFLVLFVGILLGGALAVMRLAPRFRAASPRGKLAMAVATMALLGGLIWGLHLGAGLSLFAAILCSVISSTLLSLYAIDASELARFGDHLRFVVMIFIYSGFWVLYFQMFDSVLWYVQAYVDASSLDAAVQSALAALGVQMQWRFDVEHVTAVNAGTIIALQLVVSALVKNTRALPTMVVGIGCATVGMAILAISSGIWVFLAGIVIFSVGEMTAHPKFISYVGQTAPKARVAMYMGYLFLYGVIGSSIGSVLGANLYVRYVDELNQPRTLWLIFTGIGVGTVVGLLVYDWVVRRLDRARSASEGAGADV